MPKIYRYDITDTFANVSFSTYTQRGLTEYINDIIRRDGFLPTNREEPLKQAMKHEVDNRTIRCFFCRLKQNQIENKLIHDLRLARRFNIVFVPLEIKQYYKETVSIVNLKNVSVKNY